MFGMIDDDRFKKLRRTLQVGAAVSAMLVPLPVLAQDAATSVDEEVDDDDAIIVTGLRASLEDALNIRRNADVVLDGISSDDIGSTPDLNLGEALQRIPGVQINREASRRDASISVRGLPGRFTKTTVQGQSIASTARGTNTGNPFGIFDGSIFNGANVIKSFIADTPSGGLAAQVDLRIRSALDQREDIILRPEINYEETSEAFNKAFFGKVVRKIGDRFGIYGTVAYSEQNFRRDSFRINEYAAFNNQQVGQLAEGTLVSGNGFTLRDIAAGPNPAFDIAEVGENGLNNTVIFPRQIRQITDDIRGDRLSGAAGIAYEITDNLQFRVDGIFTRRDLDQAGADLLVIDALSSTRALVTPLSDPVSVGTLDFDQNDTPENVFVVPRVLASNVRTSLSNRFQPGFDEAWAVYPQFNFENDDWRFDVIGTYSEATGFFDQTTFGLNANSRGGNATDGDLDGLNDRGAVGNFVLFDTGLGNFDDVRVELNFPDQFMFQPEDIDRFLISSNLNNISLIFPDDSTVANDGSLFEDNIGGGLGGFIESVERDLKTIDVDLARKFETGFITEIGVGGFYSSENSVKVREDNTITGLDITQLSSDLVIQNLTVREGATFLGGQIPGVEFDNFLSVDIPAFRDALGPVVREPNPEIEADFDSSRRVNDRISFFEELTEASAASITYAEVLQAAEFNPTQPFLTSRFPFSRNAESNFSSSRDTLELYGMAKFDFLYAMDVPLRGNIGLRYVKTDLSGLVNAERARGFYERLAAVRAENGGPELEFRPDALLDADPASRSFEQFLPSVNLIYEITPELVIRGAYYETFEALDIAEFVPAPTSIVEVQPGLGSDDDLFNDDGTIDLGEGGGGNGQLLGADGLPIPRALVNISSLDLQPRQSTGFDLGISWYNRPGSVISLGFFHKTLENDIQRRRNDCPASGTLTVLGRTFNDLRIADPNSLDEIERAFEGNCVFTNDLGDPQRIRINQFVNVEDSIKVIGFEGQIQQNFDFLPGPLKHTGMVLNYTRVRFAGDNDVQLFNVAEDTYNLIGYYDDKFFQARLAYNNQSEIELQGQGSFSGGNTRVASRGQLDFSGAIKPSRHFQIRFEVFNITKSGRREFLVTEELFRRSDFDGRTYSVSTTLRF